MLNISVFNQKNAVTEKANSNELDQEYSQ